MTNEVKSEQKQSTCGPASIRTGTCQTCTLTPLKKGWNRPADKTAAEAASNSWTDYYRQTEDSDLSPKTSRSDYTDQSVLWHFLLTKPVILHFCAKFSRMCSHVTTQCMGQKNCFIFMTMSLYSSPSLQSAAVGRLKHFLVYRSDQQTKCHNKLKLYPKSHRAAQCSHFPTLSFFPQTHPLLHTATQKDKIYFQLIK